MILAQQGQDVHGNVNPVCADLIQQIIEICHTIVVDDILWVKYDEQLNRMGYHHPNSGPFLMRSLWNALTVSEKVEGSVTPRQLLRTKSLFQLAAKTTLISSGSRWKQVRSSSQPMEHFGTT